MKSYNITQIPFETGRLELCAKQPFIKIYSHVHWLSNSHNSKPVFLEILLDICMYMKERHLFQFDYFQKSLNFLRVSYFMTMTVFLETFSFCNALWYLIAKEIECNKQESLKFHATKSIVKMINKQTLLIGPNKLKFLGF